MIARILTGWLLAVAVLASPAVAQTTRPTTGTGTGTGGTRPNTGTGTGGTTGGSTTDLSAVLAGLSATQQAQALSALNALSTATGASLGQLASAAGITLPSGVNGGAVTTVNLGNLTADQLAAAQTALNNLASATGISATQLASTLGITQAAGTGNTAGNTPAGGGTANGTGGSAMSGGTAPVTTTAGPSTAGNTTAKSLAGRDVVIPPSFQFPLLGGVPLPGPAVDYLALRATWLLQYAEDQGVVYATPMARFQAFSDAFDFAARQIFGNGYSGGGVTYWIIRAQLTDR